jgi:enterochelin esterase family protein
MINKLLLVLLALTTGTAAATLRVPEDYPTPRLALEAAANGDTVLINNGTIPRQVYFQSNTVVLIGQSILGDQFRDFVDRVNSLPGSARSAIVDSFLNAAPGFPFVESEVFCYFLYRGSASSVAVAGDFTGWTPNSFMTKLDSTNLWFREAVFETDARLDYKFVINGNNWILDPRNPNTISGGFGPNSELAMTEYVQPWEINANPAIPHGSIETITVSSTVLGNSRQVKIYLPPNYPTASSDSFPMILFHDGLEYLSLANTKNIFDNLIAEQRIMPTIGVFVPPVNRNEEYGFSQRLQYESFIIDELMPILTSSYRIKSNPNARAMTGPSLGGLITTQICYNHPNVFGLAAPYSPSYWANNRVVFNSVVNGPVKPVRFYIDWGTYEQSIMQDARLMRDYLDNAGYQLIWSEWHEGHSWGSWRAHLDNALEFFFPENATGLIAPTSSPADFGLQQNYPNPFNPKTTIQFTLYQPGKVKLEIFDAVGQIVNTPLSGNLPAGTYYVDWSATTNTGEPVASGLYFYRLSNNKSQQTRRMLLIR